MRTQVHVRHSVFLVFTDVDNDRMHIVNNQVNVQLLWLMLKTYSEIKTELYVYMNLSTTTTSGVVALLYC